MKNYDSRKDTEKHIMCQYFSGGFYWICGKCGCKVEKTGL